LRGRVDAAVVAVPNGLHAEVARGLLEEGIHVLCEKPLALTAADGRSMCEASERSGATLAVGFVTRFHPATTHLKHAIDDRLFGDVVDYDLEFGVRFEWAAVSGFYFDRRQSGGGVLMNEAIHTLDRLIYWFGDVTSVACVDNDQGGIETDATLTLTHAGPHGPVRGVARFSWLYPLRNTLDVHGTEGHAVFEKDNRVSVQLHRAVSGRRLRLELGDPRASIEPVAYFSAQLDDFIDAVASGGSPRVSGREGLKSVALVEAAYETAVHTAPEWAQVPA
jgi:predicted dehydrogenase